MKIGTALLLLFILFGVVFFVFSAKNNTISEATLKKYSNSFQKHLNKISSKNVAIIIDYTMPINRKRLWLINTKTNKIIFNCYVAHAISSGFIYAQDLSNNIGSEKSCGGSFLSKEKYIGNYGNSLRIDGLEKINNNARKRCIVFHPLTKIKMKGFTIPKMYAYYSLGCFALAENDLQFILNHLSEGSFIYVNTN